MSHRRKWLFWAIYAAALLALIELMSFVVGGMIDKKMFSEEDAYFASINQEQFEQWRASPWFDAELGWNTPKVKMTENRKNCLGQPVTYSYEDEHRGTPRSGSGSAAVALFGDSFAHGSEVDDESTPAAVLETLINAPVLNYGVPAYGPDQAVLKFERLASTHEMPKVAVLIIVHENIRRIVTSFRPVYYSFTDMRFGLKPYVRDGAFIVPQTVHNYDEFLAEARRRFSDDFWTRPRFAFPYSLNVLRAVISNTFYFSKIASRGEGYKSGNQLRQAMDDVIARWRSSAAAKGVRPFVLFLPEAPRDRGAAAGYVKELNAKAGDTFAFQFENPDMDWNLYNLRPGGKCHPSAYGYEHIAYFIAKNMLAPSMVGSR